MSSPIIRVSMKTRRRIGQRRPISASTPSTKAVSLAMTTPHPLPPADRGEDQRRQDHPAQRGQHGDRDAAALAQLAHVELAADLQPDDEEEQRHEAVVDPAPEVHVQAVSAQGHRQLGRPEVLVGAADVRPHERCRRRPEQDDRAAGLGLQEGANGRRDLARPCRGPRKPPACVGRRHPNEDTYARSRGPLALQPRRRDGAPQRRGRAGAACPSGARSRRSSSACGAAGASRASPS